MKRLSASFICLLLSIVFLASCSSSTNSAAPPASSAPQVSSAPGAAYAPPQSASPGNGAAADSSATETIGPLPILTPSEAENKKLIYTLTLRLQTTDFMLGNRKLLNTVSDIGGYLMTASIDGRDMRLPATERKANYEFRVPTERLTELLIVIEDNYNLWSLRQTAQDVTTGYIKSDIRLEDLVEQEQRLLETLRVEEEAEAILALEKRLSDVQNQISELRSLQLSVDDSVIFSFVNIDLFEVIFVEEEEAEPVLPMPFSEKLNMGISDSISGFVNFCQGFLLFIIAIAPVLLILAILGAIVLIIIRIVRKHHKKRIPPPPPSPQPQPQPPPPTVVNNQHNNNQSS